MTGSSGEESSRSWRAASRPESVRGRDFAATNLGGKGQHAAEHVAEWRAVVTADPPPEREELGAENGFGIEQAQCVARGDFRSIVVAAQDDAGEFAGAEGDENAATRADAMPQGVRQRIRERLVQRYGQTNVAVEVRSLGHGNFRIACGYRENGQEPRSWRAGRWLSSSWAVFSGGQTAPMRVG